MLASRWDRWLGPIDDVMPLYLYGYKHVLQHFTTFYIHHCHYWTGTVSVLAKSEMISHCLILPRAVGVDEIHVRDQSLREVTLSLTWCFCRYRITAVLYTRITDYVYCDIEGPCPKTAWKEFNVSWTAVHTSCSLSTLTSYQIGDASSYYKKSLWVVSSYKINNGAYCRCTRTYQLAAGLSYAGPSTY